jgi:endo-1,3(4)-beta-glucanase
MDADGRGRKCVIIAAYANAYPQVAAAFSANITDWGTGNTYTNNLHFIGTRANPTGVPICGALPSNPVGSFTLQVIILASAAGRTC